MTCTQYITLYIYNPTLAYLYAYMFSLPEIVHNGSEVKCFFEVYVFTNLCITPDLCM